MPKFVWYIKYSLFMVVGLSEIGLNMLRSIRIATRQEKPVSRCIQRTEAASFVLDSLRDAYQGNAYYPAVRNMSQAG